MSKSLNHIPHLDTLRIFAALIVVLEHFLGDWNMADVGMGRYGVDVFFGISGFLITSILLKQRSSAKSKFLLIRNFFLRRAFRLFPAYYALLIALLVFGVATGLWISDKENLVYYFSYTPNVLFYLKGYQSTVLNHTWSLGIEEQFYLIWPWVILLVSGRAVLSVIALFTIGGIFARNFLPQIVPGLGDMNFLPPGNFHTLGLGGLLGYVVVYNKTRLLNFLNKYNIYIAMSCLSGFFLVFPHRYELLLLHDLLVAVASVSLVYQAYIGFPGLAGKIFDLKPLQYLGKISYGIYLYHKPIPLIIILVLARKGFVLDPVAGFSLCLILTFVISHLSWKYFEKPILKLKERFDS